jgi:hypothetical protein
LLCNYFKFLTSLNFARVEFWLPGFLNELIRHLQINYLIFFARLEGGDKDLIEVALFCVGTCCAIKRDLDFIHF